MPAPGAPARPPDVASHSAYSGSTEWGAAPTWRRCWTAWLIIFLVSGAVGDTVAYTQVGWTATLTATIRRLTGQEPRTRFGRLGQVALVAFLAWATVHLGFGILGPVRGRG
jgi:hypothetical protein